MARPRTAVVADASGVARAALARRLREELGWEVLLETGDGLETVAAVRRLSPDVLFVADRLHTLDGHGVRTALEPFPRTLVLGITDDPRVLAGRVPAVMKNAGSDRIHRTAVDAWAAPW